ncbi:MAG: glycosyltransferase family 4 protein [Armatimonadota bacterium]
MKIAVFHNLPSGGAKRALYGFVKYLTRTRHVVNVYIPDTADERFLPLKDFAYGFQVFPVKVSPVRNRTALNLLGRLSPTWPDLANLEEAQKDIAKVINQSDDEVVLVEQDQFTMSPFILKYLDKPNVYYCQQPVIGPAEVTQGTARKRSTLAQYTNLAADLWRKHMGRMSLKIDQQNAAFARYVLVNSQFSKEMVLKSYGIEPFICYLGVDTEVFKPLWIPRENFVLSVGVCRRGKGFDFLIKSLGRIDKRLRPRLVIVSNRANRLWEAYLRGLALSNGVQVEMEHLVEDRELVSLYNRARVVVYAPRREPFGLVPLEAMACGTPVIAVNEGGPGETVISNETGILTERNESEFAQAITLLLTDEKRREQMGRRSLEAVREHWNLERAGERLVGHLRSAIEQWDHGM